MRKEQHKILIAEDDTHLGTLLADYLGAEGFDVTLCRDGEAAFNTCKNNRYHLYLLDVMMPKMDGFTLAEKIRSHDKITPIIFITAKSLKEDKLLGYALGADDYIGKPFDEEELLWKIKALIKRTSPVRIENNHSLISIGNFVFDPQNQSLCIENKTQRITEKECEILLYLSNHSNKLVKREDMLKHLWGENDYFLGRSLDVFITKIRKYLKEDQSIEIENVFGVGFIFKVPEA